MRGLEEAVLADDGNARRAMPLFRAAQTASCNQTRVSATVTRWSRKSVRCGRLKS